MFVRQLEMGKSELKGVTMGLLVTLNKLWVPGTLEMWGRRACDWQAYSRENASEEDDSVQVVRKFIDMQDPDIAIVAVIAWREVQEAGVMKGWEEGNKSVQLVSQACRTVLGEFDGKLDRLSSFLKLCKLGSILVEVVKTQLKYELEILDINTFT